MERTIQYILFAKKFLVPQTSPCIRQEDVFPYTLEDNTISIDGGGYWSIKIEGDILTIDDILINQRTLTFDYSDCE